jgi:Domain of unknown function DUF29
LIGPGGRAAGDKANDAEPDWLNIAGDVEGMGRARRNQSTDRPAILLARLLTWRVRPERRGYNWHLATVEQRRRPERIMRRSRSRRPRPGETLAEPHREAVSIAAREADVSEGVLPPVCPWAMDRALTSELAREHP